MKGKKGRGPGRKLREPSTRMDVSMPLLMRQAIRDREKMSNQTGQAVVQGILLTALRVEMELIKRREGAFSPEDARRLHGGGPESGFRKVEGG